MVNDLSIISKELDTAGIIIIKIMIIIIKDSAQPYPTIERAY